MFWSINQMTKIIDILIYQKAVRLKTAYKLSYGCLDAFESIIVNMILSDGTILIGEVTPLLGYSEETVESTLAELSRFKELVLFKTAKQASKVLLSNLTPNNSFAVSSMLPPIENYMYSFNADITLQLPFSLVYAVDYDTAWIDELYDISKVASPQNPATVKIKVGKNLKEELRFIEKLKELKLPNLRLRFDANGGYSYEEALIFMNGLLYIAEFVEYLEQPFGKECWSDMERLISQNIGIPIMIDESICSKEDILRAHLIGAKYIKIKLCKFGSLIELQNALDYAKSLDLNVIFGNGVATDIANYYEIIFYLKNKGKIYGAVESVGFLKIQDYLAYDINGGNCGCARI